jgi:hypothetical protein
MMPNFQYVGMQQVSGILDENFLFGLFLRISGQKHAPILAA